MGGWYAGELGLFAGVVVVKNPRMRGIFSESSTPLIYSISDQDLGVKIANFSAGAKLRSDRGPLLSLSMIRQGAPRKMKKQLTKDKVLVVSGFLLSRANIYIALIGPLLQLIVVI
ncbi:hypothetical protein B0H14DRAFT_2570478 [Mycena olivaceomarginata]|nr:hypothetical protein B0H14DRAFT_2570478 [Mycena olivaceomarginata]